MLTDEDIATIETAVEDVVNRQTFTLYVGQVRGLLRERRLFMAVVNSATAWNAEMSYDCNTENRSRLIQALYDFEKR